MPLCWNGRRGGLKIRCQQWRVGSSPTSGTTKIVALKAHFLFESSRGQAQFLFMRPNENRAYAGDFAATAIRRRNSKKADKFIIAGTPFG